MPEAKSKPFLSNQVGRNPVHEPGATPKPKLLDRLAFAVPSTRSKVIMEDYMPIRIRPRDMIIALTQQSDISLAMTDAILVSQASYAAPDAVFWVSIRYISRGIYEERAHTAHWIWSNK